MKNWIIVTKLTKFLIRFLNTRWNVLNYNLCKNTYSTGILIGAIEKTRAKINWFRYSTTVKFKTTSKWSKPWSISTEISAVNPKT